MSLPAIFSELLTSRKNFLALLGLVIVLSAIGNLPWHLDNYDQAKQAYVAYEIAHGGDVFYQHTSRGNIATKPPLAGWISLPVFWSTGSWDLAWRLPGFLAFLALLWLLTQESRRLLPEGGATIAVAAFGLNLLTPRIATLVRTDMILTLWITLCGWIILRKVRTGEAWTVSERWCFFAAMLAALLTKGPILYAFLIPGMIAFAFLAGKEHRHLVWSGWWTWLIPFLFFLAWGIGGLLSNKDFYQEVVVNELFSRFDQSLKAHETQQPIWFYFPHLLHKFLPWSLLLIALPAFSTNVRRAARNHPETLWLACWALGGLLLMTLVPSKRVDRIFPVIPPLVLLLVAMIHACQCGQRIRSWCGAAILAAVLFSGSYFLGVVWLGFRDANDSLVRFGREAAAMALQTGDGRLALVEGRDEGLPMYLGVTEMIHPHRAARYWQGDRIDAVVIPERRIDPNLNLPPPALISKEQPSGDRYLLFLK